MASQAIVAGARRERWMYDPALWAADCIAWPDGEGLTPYQEDAVTRLAVRRRAAIRGPHGLGKSTTASISVLWFATTRELAGWDWKAIITASAWRHLAVYLMPEIAKWARRLRWDVLGLPAWTSNELLALSIKLRHGAATAVASNKPELIEGAHADSLLYVLDEGKAIPDGTWDAVEGAFSGGRPDGLPEAFALAISTPGPPAGRFYEIHKRAPGLEDWDTRHVTVDEAVAAGRISREWVEQRRRQWGEDSAMFQQRVLGEFHASDEDSVIPLAWVEAAVERWREWDQAGRPAPEGVRTVGVDVARAGGDSTILAHRSGPVVTGLDAYDRQDTMGTVARVQGVLGGGGVVPVVDSAGVGGGVVDRLRELGVPVEAYTGAARTGRRTRDREYGFTNTRSGALWRVRELLDPAHGATLALPDDDLLVSDLTTPTWDIVTGNPPRVRVESKEQLTARLGRSPDRGDAVMMALWVDAGTAPVVRSPARGGARGGATVAGSRYGQSVGR